MTARTTQRQHVWVVEMKLGHAGAEWGTVSVMALKRRDRRMRLLLGRLKALHTRSKFRVTRYEATR